MVLFFVALSAEWCNRHVASWVAIGTSIVVVFSLVGWCIWTARDRTRHWWFQAEPDQSPRNVIQDQHQGEGDVKESLHSLLMKRIPVFFSAYLKTKEHDFTTDEKKPAEELHTRHCSHLGLNPNGDAEDLHVRVADEVMEERNTHSASSSPVIFTVRQPTLLPDGPDPIS